MRKPRLDDPRYDDSDPRLDTDEAVNRIIRYQDAMARWYAEAGARVLAKFRRRGVVKLPAHWGGYNVLHRSTKTSGRFQLSFFDENMEPWGDTESDDLSKLIKRMLEEMPSRRRR